MSILEVEGAKEIALELNSLSKTFNMAGWRVGMLLGNATHIKEVLKVKSNMDSGMFYGIQKGAGCFYQEIELERNHYFIRCMITPSYLHQS